MTMMQELYLADGTRVSKEIIRKAVAERRAVLRWAHGNGFNRASLLIYEDAQSAAMESERNTVGKCYSMADEIWSELATSTGAATRAAAGLLTVS